MRSDVRRGERGHRQLDRVGHRVQARALLLAQLIEVARAVDGAGDLVLRVHQRHAALDRVADQLDEIDVVREVSRVAVDVAHGRPSYTYVQSVTAGSSSRPRRTS